MKFPKRIIVIRFFALILLFCILGGLKIPFFGSFLSFDVKNARAAISLVQTTNNVTGGNGNSSLAATYGSTPVQGNLLVAVAAANSGSINTPSGWSVAVNRGTVQSKAIFYKIAGASEATTVTVTQTGTSHMGLHIYEYSGIEKSSPLDGVTSSTGSGTSLSVSGLVTSQPDDLLIAGFVVDADPSTFTWGSSFTEQNDFSNGSGNSGNRASYSGADRIVTATSTYGTNATTTLTGSWTGVMAAFKADIQFEQASYRWFANTDSAAVGSPLAAQNIGATISTPGTPIRLRMLLHVSSTPMHASGRNLKLQFVARGSGTCAGPSGGSPAVYTDVATSTGVIRYYNNASIADGAALTSTSTDPTHSSHTVVNQTYEEQNNFTNTQGAIPAGQDGKWDFSVIDSSAQAGETYCFRAVDADGSVLDTYTQYPNVVVGNIAPTITNVAVNGGSDIALTEGTTTLIQTTATVSDPNGFTDISTTTGKLYRSGVGEACSQNDNSCYQQTSSTCSLSSCSGTSCTATCSYRVWFHADPTDSGTPWESENWLSWMKTVDGSNASATATSSPGVEMLTLLALSVTPNINYGTLSVGSTTDPLSPSTTVSSTGNASMDVTLYGVNMTSGGNSITVGNQRYATSATAFSSGLALLASPGALLELNLPKTIATSSRASSTLFWGIQIPNLTVSGNYTGANSFIGTVNSLPWP
jgi:hypothetical protein